MLSKFFTITDRPGIGARLFQGGEVHYRSLTPALALKYWKLGFPYLHITAAGAAEFFGNATAEERNRTYLWCKTDAELDIFRKQFRTKASAKSEEVPTTTAPADTDTELPVASDRRARKPRTTDAQAPPSPAAGEADGTSE